MSANEIAIKLDLSRVKTNSDVAKLLNGAAKTLENAANAISKRNFTEDDDRSSITVTVDPGSSGSSGGDSGSSVTVSGSTSSGGDPNVSVSGSVTVGNDGSTSGSASVSISW